MAAETKKLDCETGEKRRIGRIAGCGSVKNNRERHIQIRVTVILNAQETVVIDRLAESGLYGITRAQTVRRLMDERLVQLLNSSHDGHGRNGHKRQEA